MPQPVQIGAMIPAGVEHLKLFKALRFGDTVLTFMPSDKVEALAMARYCKEQRLHLYFDEVTCRGSKDFCHGLFTMGWSGHHRARIPRNEFHTKAELDEILDAAGEFYAGRVVVPEAGGILYWPKAYCIGRGVGQFVNLPPARTMEEARDAYVEYLKDFVDFERAQIGKGPLMNADSSLVFKYHVQAGVDALCLESMPGDPHLMHSAVRGAARTFARPWGTHIAMECYGGMSYDELWMKRWKTAVYHAYLCGAGFIWSESGHYKYTDQQHGKKIVPFHAAGPKRMRRVLREAYQFSRIHTRPANGPRVKFAVAYGNMDGAPGLWNRYAWGQYKGRKWLEGPAERGWRLVDKFHRKEDWPRETVQGDVDFSGNPPLGQYDVVPIEAPLDVLKRYSCLVFLGWNTMTPEIYEKLKAYVRGGGHLVMYLCHLSTHTDRAADLKLFRRGDFHDLFGVRILGKGRTDVQGIKCLANSSLASYRFPLWRANTDPRFLGQFTPAKCRLTTGRIISVHDDFYSTPLKQLARQPFLIENSLGMGKAFLVAAWEYPADEGLIRFTEDLLRTVLQGEQGDVRLLASDRVRYAVYDGTAPGSRRKYSVIYLLNTDPDCASPVKLWLRGRATPAFDLPANELRLAYLLDRLLLLPEDPRVDLREWREFAGRSAARFVSPCDQNLAVINLGRSKKTISVNGASCAVQPGERRLLALRRTVDPGRKEFYAPDFLEEPVPRSLPAAVSFD